MQRIVIRVEYNPDVELPTMATIEHPDVELATIEDPSSSLVESDCDRFGSFQLPDLPPPVSPTLEQHLLQAVNNTQEDKLIHLELIISNMEKKPIVSDEVLERECCQNVDEVLRDIIRTYHISNEDIIIQSDNAPAQYKNKFAFGLLQKFSNEFNLRIIRTYGCALVSNGKSY